MSKGAFGVKGAESSIAKARLASKARNRRPRA